MTFRSLQMSQYQMVIPRDSAYSTINLLGYQDTIHLTDSADSSNRVFSQMVKRCDDCLQKLELINAALSKQNIAVQQQIHDFDLLVPRLKNKWKQQAKGLGQQENKLIDTYEERVSEQYQRFQDLTHRIQKMADNHQQNLQKIACLQILTQSFGDLRPKRQNQEYYIKNISEIDQIHSVSFLIGVVDYQLQWKINRIIYRVSRGYACTKTLTQFKFPGLKNFNKKAIIVIYPSSQNLTLEKRILRVMQTFSTNVFLEHQLEYSAKQMYEKAISEYNQITNLYQMGQKQYKQFLKSMNESNQIQILRTFFWKEKKLYEVMNMLDRRQQFFIGNIYIPKKQINRISLLLNKIVPSPTLHSIPLEFPPTAFDTNSYTTIAQEITDTYGVPRYNQINPSIFATITFPFFFGVMFGDILHGIMVFALGLYAVMNSNSLQKGPLSLLARFKYMIILMGFFSIYCGFIYNDFAGFNMNFFSSCFTPPPHPAQDEEIKQLRPVHSAPDCVYAFGIDPIWGRAQNQLVFVNSLKMKISVIIAIIHMTFGVICKGINTNYFKKKLDFYFQFIPQLIFLVLLFGYMDFLIIFKWLKHWDQRVGDIAPQQWAPSIIATMMNIMLSFGKTTTAPDGNSNMWGQRGNSYQDLIQFFILIICVICIPLMLFPKPYIKTHKLKKNISNMKKNPLANQQQDFFEQSKIALQQKLYSNKLLQNQSSNIEEHQNSSQIFVHQLIETIQFVLGTISNTASYLRLWALSLAHSQLSKVFFQQTAGRFFGDKLYFQIPSLFIGSWMVMWITFGIILCMDSMECFLHALRLHWVEFQNKFYKGDGYRYNPLSFKQQIIRNKKDA